MIEFAKFLSPIGIINPYPLVNNSFGGEWVYLFDVDTIWMTKLFV